MPGREAPGNETDRPLAESSADEASEPSQQSTENRPQKPPRTLNQGALGVQMSSVYVLTNSLIDCAFHSTHSARQGWPFRHARRGPHVIPSAARNLESEAMGLVAVGF